MTGHAMITGIGVTAPNGLGLDAYWEATLAGKSGLGRITRFEPDGYPVQVGGEVADFVTSDHVPGRLAVETDHWTHLGLAAAAMALDDADVDTAKVGEYEMAVVTASSSGGTTFGQREIEKLWSRGPRTVGTYQSIAWFYAASSGQISIRHGMRGPCGVFCSEQAGGLEAAAHARRLLARGSKLVVVGGTDASLCPYGLTAQLSTGWLSTNDDPGRAYLPFDECAAGYVPGEGGAKLVVEEASWADDRGAPRRYARIMGFASTFDPRPGSGRPPALRRAIEQALADAAVEPRQVDVVFADAMGVPEADRAEATALTAVFGPLGVPVTAPKTMTGRLYAGGAALDLATAALAIRDDVIPPTVGVADPFGGCGLDLVLDRPREQAVRTALVVARGHGGFNGAMVLGAIEGSGG